MAVAREQAHPLAVELNDQVIAVMLDLVDPLRAIRHLSRLGGNAGTRYLGSLVPNEPRDVRANCRAGLDLDLNRMARVAR